MPFAIAAESMALLLPDACVPEVTPPTFAGIASLVANLDGSGTAAWAPASGGSLPTRYNLYIQALTSVGLFTSGNRIPMGSGYTSASIYRLPDDTKLQDGVVYHVGVRAVTAVGIEDSNTVSLSFTSAGVLDDDCASLGQKVNQLLSAAAPELVMSVSAGELSMELENGSLIMELEDC